MAAAGNSAITMPVARPTPPPSTPPTRVGVSCFLTILTLPSLRRSMTAASYASMRFGLGVEHLDRVVVGSRGLGVGVHAAEDEERVDCHGAGSLRSEFVPPRPRQDSNLRTRLRRPMLYPLSYEGRFDRDGRRRGRA